MSRRLRSAFATVVTPRSCPASGTSVSRRKRTHRSAAFSTALRWCRAATTTSVWVCRPIRRRATRIARTGRPSRTAEGLLFERLLHRQAARLFQSDRRKRQALLRVPDVHRRRTGRCRRQASDIAKYHGRYDEGFDALRESRLARQVELGLLDPSVVAHRPVIEDRQLVQPVAGTAGGTGASDGDIRRDGRPPGPQRRARNRLSQTHRPIRQYVHPVHL